VSGIPSLLLSCLRTDIAPRQLNMTLPCTLPLSLLARLHLQSSHHIRHSRAFGFDRESETNWQSWGVAWLRSAFFLHPRSGCFREDQRYAQKPEISGRAKESHNFCSFDVDTTLQIAAWAIHGAMWVYLQYWSAFQRLRDSVRASPEQGLDNEAIWAGPLSWSWPPNRGRRYSLISLTILTSQTKSKCRRTRSEFPLFAFSFCSTTSRTSKRLKIAP